MEKVDNSPIQVSGKKILGVFCKAPVAGQVKTRLCPPLQPEEAAELYRTALSETLQRFSGQDFELVICHAGAPDFFARHFPELRRQPQVGADLGARMAHALEGFLAAGAVAAILIGSDSPDLPLTILEQAFSALQHDRVVIAPATDGGYVLIGESCHQPVLFADMPWSEPELMQRTRAVLQRENLAWSELPGWEDIDDAASLRRLLERSPESLTARHIRLLPGFASPQPDEG